MTSVLQKLLVGLFFISFGLSAIAAEQSDKQLDKPALLHKYLIGDFANVRSLLEKGTSFGHPAIFLQNTRLPSNGHFVIWSRQSLLNNPSIVYRNHVYQFVSRRGGDVVIQQIYLAPAHWAPMDSDWQDLERLRGCDIIWRYHEAGFVGRREDQRCGFIDEHGREVFLSTELRLDAHQFSVADAGMAPDGEFVFGSDPDAPMLFERIRFFVAEFAFLPPGADSEQDTLWIAAEPYRVLHDHDLRVPLVSQSERMFLGHDIQLSASATDSELLIMRLHRHTDDQEVLRLEVVGENGVWEAQASWFRARLRLTDDVSGSPRH